VPQPPSSARAPPRRAHFSTSVPRPLQRLRRARSCAARAPAHAATARLGPPAPTRLRAAARSGPPAPAPHEPQPPGAAPREGPKEAERKSQEEAPPVEEKKALERRKTEEKEK
jgi:hypothetical protein